MSCGHLLAATQPSFAPVLKNQLQEGLQTLDRVNNRRLDLDPLEAQQLRGLRVVEFVGLIRGCWLSTLNALRRQLVLELGEVLPRRIQNAPVGVGARRREEPVAADLRLLKGQDVSPGHVAHVDPVGDARGGDSLLPLALCEGHDALVGGVDGVQACEVVYHGAEDHRRVDGHEIKFGIVGLVVDKVPCCLLGELLGGAVGGRAVLVDVLDCHRVPGLLGEGGAGVVYLGRVEDGSKGRSNDHALHAWGRFGDGLEDASCADNGGVDEVLLGVCDVEMEGRSCVEDDLDTRGLDNLVESVGLRDIGHNRRLQTVLPQAGVGGVDLGRLVLRTDSGHNIVATLQKLLEDVSRNKARATYGDLLAGPVNQAAVRFLVRTGEKNFGHFDNLDCLVLVL